MKIGQSVKYVRHVVKTDKTEVGEGVIKAIGLDPDNRMIILVQSKVLLGEDGKPAVFHVHDKCINPSEIVIENFDNMVKAIKKVEKDANDEIKGITDKANLTIDKLKDNMLGEPIEL